MQVDSFLKVRYQGEVCLVDIEIQAEAESKMGWRLYKYAARASSIFDLPVISVVFWLERHGRIPPSPFEIRIGKHLSGVWHYTSIEVYRLKAAEILALGEQDIVGLLPLVPLTHDGGTVEQIEAAGKVAQEHASSEEEQVSIITLLGILASRRIDRELADALVRRLVMSQDLLESSPLYQKWAEEWLAQGMEKGLEQGLEQGLERGREEGLTIGVRESVQLVLRARFKALPPEVEQAIAQASRAALEDVLTHVSDESLDQLRVRLETAPQQ